MESGNIVEPRLNIITLGVKDLDAALDFYENGLGWKRSSASQDDIAFIQLRGIVLALYPRDALAEDAGMPVDSRAIEDRLAVMGRSFPGFTLAYNTRSEAEVDAVMDHVAKLGAEIVKKPRKVFWGGYSGYFKDPDGYLFEVAYNPFFPMTEEGLIHLA